MGEISDSGDNYLSKILGQARGYGIQWTHEELELDRNREYFYFYFFI